ncbi:TPA: hypothetical protein QDB02_002474 [Burkholderia vietnamiensis]|jgi:hypothetical protein|uniref:hypothetical protein n=1 Tax=Burkholderia vietnamiensis TaxID=60552 RepID=UPI001B965DC7|nr:hypothetical protein [Burkholderia vietnamiensis]MBR7976982.1 hypothetical protein [Burkholderia vietnamiensis]HDR9054748.1 hypothetical protein [Burkholderia vietnamiensis]
MTSCEDFANFGRSLLTDGAPEIALRSGASRIYYAAYHLCQQYADQYCTPLQEKDKEDAGGNHAQLYKRLSENSKSLNLDEPLRNVVEIAKKMKALRVCADYKLDRDFTSRDAQRCSAYWDAVKSACAEVDEASS